MRYSKHTLAALAVCLLALSVSGFAGAISHVGGPIDPVSRTHTYGAITKNSPLVYFQNPDFNGAYSSQNDTTDGFRQFRDRL